MNGLESQWSNHEYRSEYEGSEGKLLTLKGSIGFIEFKNFLD